MHPSGGSGPAAQGRPGPPQAEPPAPRRHGLGRSALRQLMVTPTFVLSVTIVTMAVLAFSTTQTSLRFSSGPDTGCGISGCTRPGAGNAPGARPPGGAVPDGSGHTPALRAAGPASAGSARGVRVPRIAYRTIETLPAGFSGLISITGRGHLATRRWWLAVRYPGVRISAMSGAAWHTDDDGTVTIQPLPQTPELRPGHTLPILFSAFGVPGPPSGCRFDGARCRVSWS